MNRSQRRTALAVAVLPLAVSATFATSAEAKTRAPECVAGPQWTRSVPGFAATARKVTYTGAEGGSVTFTTTKSETVDLEASASLEVGGSAGFASFSASVKAQVGVKAIKSTTVEKGYSQTFNLPANRRNVMQFGVETRRLSGVYLVDRATLGLPAPTFAVPGLPAGCTLRGLQKLSAVIPTDAPTYKIKNYRLRKKG